jgi:arylsulfatase
MKQLGLLGANANVFPRLPDIPAWDQLTPEQQKSSARKMEVYAAMLANMDFHIGRVLDHLEQSDRLDDTLVVFLSDNGAESIEFEKLVELNFSADALKWVEANFDMRPESWGRKGSVVDYGPAWAQVGMGPFAFFKAFVTEGGIRSPLIVAGPGVAQRGEITQAVLHVTDLMPTFLDLAGVAHPSTQPGSSLAPLRGRSLRPLLEGRADAVRGENDWLAWELFGNRAVRQGDWKLVSLVTGAGGDDDWHLYNLEDDPAELHDLSAQHPERRAAMIALWEQYAKDNGVIYTGDGMFKPRAGASASH